MAQYRYDHAGQAETTTPQSAAPNAQKQRTIDGETLPLRTEEPEYEFDALDSLARLTIGGAVEISDILLQQLERWEQEVIQQGRVTILEEKEDLGDVLRYLAVGIAIEGQRSLRSSAKKAGSFAFDAIIATSAATQPIRNSRLFGPLRKSSRAITSKLEWRIADLVRIGRSEEYLGRLIADNALQNSVDWAMDYIANNPDVRALVQQQALGFTDEIAIGVRARSITADNIFDGLLRKLLKRTPRTELPGPPDEVQALEEAFNKKERGVSE